MLPGEGQSNGMRKKLPSSKDKRFVSKPMVAYTTASVGNPFRPIDIRPSKYAHLRDLQLADKFPHASERPFQLLIAEPYFSMLEKEEQKISDDPSLPMAKLTELGWVLRGATGIKRQVKTASAYRTYAHDHESFEIETIYHSMAFDFGKFWSGENVGISQHESMTSELTALEIQAEEFQKQTAKFDPVQKRWMVCLPWINEDLESHRLSDNTKRAMAMHYKVIKTVKPEHMPLVEEAYDDLVNQGFAEIVPEDQLNPEHPVYVMNSRPVLRPDKATTKCRIVINGSLPDQCDKTRSLNKLLMPGPNKLPQIMALLMRLMCKKYIFLIDIKKMFLNVGLQMDSDKDMLRYMWGSPGTVPKIYRLLVIGFGIISSPYQATWCLHETAKRFVDKYPEAVINEPCSE